MAYDRFNAVYQTQCPKGGEETEFSSTKVFKWPKTDHHER